MANTTNNQDGGTVYRWVDIKELDMETGRQIATVRCYLKPSEGEVEFKILDPTKVGEGFVNRLRSGIETSRGPAKPSDGLIYLLRLRHAFKSSYGRRATTLKTGEEEEFAQPSQT